MILNPPKVPYTIVTLQCTTNTDGHAVGQVVDLKEWLLRCRLLARSEERRGTDFIDALELRLVTGASDLVDASRVVTCFIKADLLEKSRRAGAVACCCRLFGLGDCRPHCSLVGQEEVALVYEVMLITTRTLLEHREEVSQSCAMRDVSICCSDIDVRSFMMAPSSIKVCRQLRLLGVLSYHRQDASTTALQRTCGRSCSSSGVEFLLLASYSSSILITEKKSLEMVQFVVC